MSPSFNAVTTKGSEVPKIMGYLKYPGGGRRGSPVVATVPLLLPSKQGHTRGWEAAEGVPLQLQDTEGTQLCPRGRRDSGDWEGWIREKAKPRSHEL